MLLLVLPPSLLHEQFLLLHLLLLLYVLYELAYLGDLFLARHVHIVYPEIGFDGGLVLFEHGQASADARRNSA